MSSFYDCHGHIMMDGGNYIKAFEKLKKANVSYFRDGGDAEGKTAEAAAYAREHMDELGIEYATPVFAIHKKGLYGKIVGRAYQDIGEYRELVALAKLKGADFIKLMFSGIATFETYGGLSCESLPAAEIKELINIAHGEGFSVMAHVNGSNAVMAAVSAGVDSVEHGLFMSSECICALADSDAIWVPTLTAIAAFSGRTGTGSSAKYSPRPGFDEQTVIKTIEGHMDSVRKGIACGVKIAAGSDSGAFGAPHGIASLSEYSLLYECGASAERIISANELIRGRFRV